MGLLGMSVSLPICPLGSIVRQRLGVLLPVVVVVVGVGVVVACWVYLR